MKKLLMCSFVFLTVAPAAITVYSQPRVFPLSSLKTVDSKTSGDSDPLSDFPDKGLPEASIIGGNPSFATGADAARKIMKFDDNALPLLMAALQKGGFYIIDVREKVLYAPRSGPGLDISFFDIEVAGMLRGVGLGAGSSLSKMAAVYAGDRSQMSADEIANRMLRDIRAMRNSKDPHIQFNAGMLFEMSKLAPENGDLATAPASTIKLNMIQASLIERLLILDLLTKYEMLGGGSAVSKIFRLPRPLDANAFQFINASLTLPDYGPCNAVSDIATLKKTIKTGKKVVETVKTFGELTKDINTLDKIRDSQVVKGASVANAAFAWAKTVMAFMNLVATFELEKPMPLIRTKKSGNNVGEVRTVKIKAVMNFNHSDFINCLGSALGTATGVTFGVPKGGPMSGVGVTWQVQLTGEGYRRYTSVPVFVDAVTRDDISRQVTDDKGENTIKLTGKPQPYDLTGKAVVPLPKTVKLSAQVALDKIDAKKDIPKIIKLGLGTSIDPFAVIELVADVVMKIPLKTYNVTVPVRDWQPCTGDWGGTITYKRVFDQTIVVQGTRLGNGNSTGNGFRQITQRDNATIELNPRTAEEIAAKAERKPATYYVSGRRSDIFTGKREADPCCGPVEGKYDVTFRQGEEVTYSAVLSRREDLRISARERDFSIAIGLSTDGFKSMNRKFLEIEDTNCPIDKESAFDEYTDGIFALGDVLSDGRHGERYVDETGEIMVGTKTIPGLDKSTITWGWELARCGK